MALQHDFGSAWKNPVVTFVLVTIVKVHSYSDNPWVEVPITKIIVCEPKTQPPSKPFPVAYHLESSFPSLLRKYNLVKRPGLPRVSSDAVVGYPKQ